MLMTPPRNVVQRDHATSRCAETTPCYVVVHRAEKVRDATSCRRTAQHRVLLTDGTILRRTEEPCKCARPRDSTSCRGAAQRHVVVLIDCMTSCCTEGACNIVWCRGIALCHVVVKPHNGMWCAGTTGRHVV